MAEPTTHEWVIEQDREYVRGITLTELRKLWRENQRNIRTFFMDPGMARAFIDRKWKVLAPEFAARGLGHDFDGAELPLDRVPERIRVA